MKDNLLLDISVFGKYKVKVSGKYSYNTPSYDCPNDWHTEKVKYQKTMEGGELMEIIAKELQERDLIGIYFHDDRIMLEKFNPHTGECADWVYKIERKKVKGEF